MTAYFHRKTTVWRVKIFSNRKGGAKGVGLAVCEAYLGTSTPLCVLPLTLDRTKIAPEAGF